MDGSSLAEDVDGTVATWLPTLVPPPELAAHRQKDRLAGDSLHPPGGDPLRRPERLCIGRYHFSAGQRATPARLDGGGGLFRSEIRGRAVAAAQAQLAFGSLFPGDRRAASCERRATARR